MKRILSCLIILVFILSLCALPAAAADDLDAAFEGATASLDCYYELDGNYMASRLVWIVYPWEEMDANDYADKVISAAEYEAVLNKYFAPTAEDLEEVRRYAHYDAAAQTYTVQAAGGFGGSLPPREYLGYWKNGNTYNIYWQTVEYKFLDSLDGGWEYAESLDYPETVEYGGYTFMSGPDGYYCITGRLDSGKMYVAEYNSGIVRLLSSKEYTAQDLPVFQSISANSGISVNPGNSFAPGTRVNVAPVTTASVVNTAKTAFAKIAETFRIYNFTAKKNGVAVQPNGSVRVTITIPSDFSTDVSVYYMADNGAIEKLPTTVDAGNRQATVELRHFSYYVLTDNATAPGSPSQNPENPTQGTTPPSQSTTPPSQSTTPSTGATEPEDTTPSSDPTDSTDATTDASQPDSTTKPSENTPAPTPDQDAGDPGSDNTLLIVLLVIVLLAGAGVGGYFLYIKKFKKS